MKLFPLGINIATGNLLFDPIDAQEAGQRIQESLSKKIDEILTRAATLSDSMRFKGIEIERKRTVDRGDPREAGWTFLISERDPHTSEYIEIIKPLAERRGMEDPTKPLKFNNEQPEEWIKWYENNFHPLTTALSPSRAPQYILLVGSPDQIPFKLQSYLDILSSVGRVDFDSPEDLQTYIDKIIRLEEAGEPPTGRDAVFFATDHGIRTNGGWWDPTHFSRLYMVEKLVEYVKEERFRVHSMIGKDATKKNFLKNLTELKPAVVYTAGHGVALSNKDVQWQKRTNGAIICQELDINQPIEGQQEQEYLFTADDIPQQDTPFLEGSVFFQFACFGYGTPAESETSYWLGKAAGRDGIEVKYGAEFVASLPKKLLAHPRGPIAYIGHLDAAVLHGFTRAEEPSVTQGWETRLKPFVYAIDSLLRVNPVGLAMGDMNDRYSLCNTKLADDFDLLQRGKVEDPEAFVRELANIFVLMIDAKNYMILGDPAARPRISKD